MLSGSLLIQFLFWRCSSLAKDYFAQAVNTTVETFRLARMSPLILTLTLILLAIPVLFLANAFFGKSLLLGPALLVIAIYFWVWLRFRPTEFVVRPDAIDVAWPLKRRQIPRA